MLDIEEVIYRLRNNDVDNNCHDCSLGYVAFEAADIIEGLLKDIEARETPKIVTRKTYQCISGRTTRFYCPKCGKGQKLAKVSVDKWYCERCGQALTTEVRDG